MEKEVMYLIMSTVPNLLFIGIIALMFLKQIHNKEKEVPMWKMSLFITSAIFNALWLICNAFLFAVMQPWVLVGYLFIAIWLGVWAQLHDEKNKKHWR
jgi:hypothetical protein